MYLGVFLPARVRFIERFGEQEMSNKLHWGTPWLETGLLGAAPHLHSQNDVPSPQLL